MIALRQESLSGRTETPDQAQVRFYSPLLLARIQDALSRLADIDLRYEKVLEVARKPGRAGSLRLDDNLRLRLASRHRRERRRAADELVSVQRCLAAICRDAPGS